MPNPSFEIFPYSIDQLKKSIIEKTDAKTHHIDSKLHNTYLKDYFNALEAKTIFIENDYIDRDFLEDFAGYYVRCFTPYRRKCFRFHFFSMSFSQGDFEALLKGTGGLLSQENLQNTYLGFTVIKPLPQTIIGRTCLKTYPGDGRRYFPTVRCYNPNLFGIPLKIDTLAFQEQDQVVAACATSALWSVFQKTGKLFSHPIPSPVEITNTASIFAPLETRILPNKGLSVYQMTHAIRSVKLEPFLVKAQNEHVLKSTLYAYLNGQIPLLMGIDLVDTSDNNKIWGKHAVAITGYSLGNKTAIQYGSTGILLKASRIDKIYVHDDQVGPFARMIFDNVSLVLNGTPVNSISTSWIGRNGVIGSVRAIPDNILAPLYHKIRIPFNVIHDTIIPFDGIIEAARIKGIIPLLERLEWDIFLTTINDLKTHFFHSHCLGDGEYCCKVLLENMPKYIWRAIALNKNRPLIELLFDATDIEQGTLFIRAVEYDQTLAVALRTLSKVPKFAAGLRTKLEWKIFEWFERQP